MNKIFDLLNLYKVYATSLQAKTLEEFKEFTLKSNELFNLTAITDSDEFDEKMILDSATGLIDIDVKHKSIIDVGTGAGYPGMVLKILHPEGHFTFLDSTQKKINNLQVFAIANKITATFVADRVESYAKAHRESFDYVTARAVAALPILLETCIPLVKVNGYFIAYKGKEVESEIKDSKLALEKLNCRIERIFNFTLPSGEERNILYIKKIKETNTKYPREYNEIKRKHL